jgi:hypothetical protein
MTRGKTMNKNDSKWQNQNRVEYQDSDRVAEMAEEETK